MAIIALFGLFFVVAWLGRPSPKTTTAQGQTLKPGASVGVPTKIEVGSDEIADAVDRHEARTSRYDEYKIRAWDECERKRGKVIMGFGFEVVCVRLASVVELEVQRPPVDP